MKHILTLIFGAVVLTPAIGAEVVKSTPEVIARGKAVFLENCITCHGEKGDGNGIASKAITGAKPRDFTTGYFRRGGKPEEIFHTISEGSEGTDMPPWKDAIPENDRWALVYFVKSLKVDKKQIAGKNK